ncbi:MAG TPA: maleylpyruvate isomerase family mycothiol-dependent enzyme [Mycobacterium sp.]|nr:maleylpyruvate isomerase family mycothiol-dependent enzyme [Mycobacterium sp.]
MHYAAALLDENRAFGELVRAGDPAAPIPTCPEWNLKQLFRHVGRGHRWAAQIIADRVDHPLDPRAVEGGKPPDDPDEAITWLNDGAQRVVDAVAQAGPDTPAWTFIGPRPASWWIRRRLHEVTVHRADAALALGRGYRLAPELAADGISEWLDLAIPRAGRDGSPPPLGDGQSIHLHATDSGLASAGEWTVRADATGITWSHEHGKGAVALRGPAVDLLLATLRRVPVADTDVTAFGDLQVWQNWLDRTAF